MDLFEQVLHALEGTERSPRVWQTADGERTLERRTTGYDRWIESANDGRLEAINALAVILEGVRESFDLDVEREIVEGWAIELRAAAESGEITARNPATLLPLRAVPEGWDWLISIDDLDALVKARGMGWSCTEIVAHLLNESRKTGEKWYDENGRPAAEYWIRGYEPESLTQEIDPKPNAAAAKRGTRTDNLKRAIFDAWKNGCPLSPASAIFDYLATKDATGFVMGRAADELQWENSSGALSRTSLKSLQNRLPDYRREYEQGI